MTIREFNFKLCRIEIDLFNRSRFTGLPNGACCPWINPIENHKIYS